MKFDTSFYKSNKQSAKLPPLATLNLPKKSLLKTQKHFQSTGKYDKKIKPNKENSESTQHSHRMIKFLKPLIIPTWDHFLFKHSPLEHQTKSVRSSRKRTLSLFNQPQILMEVQPKKKIKPQNKQSERQFIIHRPRRSTWDQKAIKKELIVKFQELSQSKISLKQQEFMKRDSLIELFPE